MYFLHGMLDTSMGWVSNGVTGSQAFAAYDQGFDVWLGNCRANPPPMHIGEWGFNQCHVSCPCLCLFQFAVAVHPIALIVTLSLMLAADPKKQGAYYWHYTVNELGMEV